MTRFCSPLTLTVCLTVLGNILSVQSTIAQIIPDNSLGTESSIIRQDTIKNLPSDVIEGGASRGSNLFHSFREFNVNEGRGAYFANPAVIQNIFSRVTGGNISHILGTLGVLGNANLFLINPSGIIFGANARLDMRGAFTASTADSLIFDNGFEFSASNPDAPPLLTVNIPLGLRFRENSGDINNSAPLATPDNLTLQARNLNLSGSVVAGGELRLEALETVTIRDSIETPFFAVSGQDLLIQGSNIDIFALNHPQSAIASYGNLTLKSPHRVIGDAHYYSGGNFRIEQFDGSLGELYSPNDPVIRSQGDVFIGGYEGTSLHIIAGGSVTTDIIEITGTDSEFGLQETVTLSNGQEVLIDGKNTPTVDIRAGVDPSVISSPFLTGDGSFFSSLNFSLTPSSADINVRGIFFNSSNGFVLLTNQYHPNLTIDRGDVMGIEGIFSGEIVIDARNNINLQRSLLATMPLLSSENVGNLTLLAKKTISLNDSFLSSQTDGIGNGGNLTLIAEDISASNSSIASGVFRNGIGNGGDIVIDTNTLSLKNGTILSAATFGQGNAGAIKITATDTISLSGADSRGLASTIANIVFLDVRGNGGEILINTAHLNLTEGGQITASTLGQGNAGAIKITATDTISLSGESSLGLPSGISSLVSFSGRGNGGEIIIDTTNLSLTKGGQITASTFGQGNAGAVEITATGNILIEGESSRAFNGGIFSTVNQNGNSGGILINTTNLNLREGGRIDASTSGQGNAGAIKITATDTISLSGENSRGLTSDISSEVGLSGRGNSGGIVIDTTHLNLTRGGEINASTFGQGNAGIVQITATGNILIDGESSRAFGRAFGSRISSTVQRSGVGDSGGIILDTTNLSLTRGGEIDATTFGQGNAGRVQIMATGNILIDGESSRAFSSRISSTVQPSAVGNSGGIILDTTNLSLTRGGQINASTFGQGNAGRVQIIATGNILIDGEKSDAFGSNISSTVQRSGVGNSEGIFIDTTNLSLTRGGQINASTFGQGNAGRVQIIATGNILIDGEKSDAFESNISSTVQPNAVGNSEGIFIDTTNLSLTQGGEINASTFGQGNAGIVQITATGNILIKGQTSDAFSSGISSTVQPTNARGNSGGIFLDTTNLSLIEGGIISTSTFSQGNAGVIDITATESIALFGVNIQGEGSQISSRTESSGNANTITLNTPQITLTDGATISAEIRNAGNSGAIIVNAPNFVNLGANTNLTVETSGAGTAGNITLTTDTLTIGQNAQLSATATETATNTENRANITLNAQNINIAGQLGIFAETQSNSPAGNLTINPNNNNPNLNIRFTDNGFISARTTSAGEGGDITINAPQTIDIRGNGQITTETAGSGNAGTINISSQNINLADGLEISASTIAGANAGNINLNANNITLSQTEINASTSGIGDAGTITITADTLDLSDNSILQTNTSNTGNAGDINLIIQDRLALTQSAIEATTTPNSSGNGGNIIIDPELVSLSNESRIAVNSQGSGNGGNIFLTARNLTLNNRSTISATTASGEGGNITLNIADTLRQRNNSDITATAAGTGNGGNITINTRYLIGSGDSDITANAFEGNGGNIRITAQGIFRDLRSEITASSELGVDGIVETNTPDVDPSRGLVNLPQNIVDPNALIAQNACRKGNQSEFTVAGRGGLPNSPEQIQGSDKVSVGLIEPTADLDNDEAIIKPTSTEKERKIIPAQGWRKNEKGEFVLVADASQNEVNRALSLSGTCSSSNSQEE